MSVIKSFLVVLLLGILQNISAQSVNEAGQSIDHPDKNEYTLSLHGTDKHRFGYELNDNKHFHHTTTEEDGVRLGCYGYTLNGKKYSLQYVADIRGFRPVYTYEPIKVYPKSGEERTASFIGNLDESVDRTSNLRYFFPDGCKGTEIIIPPVIETGSGINIPLRTRVPPPLPTPTSPPTPRPPVSLPGPPKQPEPPVNTPLPPFEPTRPPVTAPPPTASRKQTAPPPQPPRVPDPPPTQKSGYNYPSPTPTYLPPTRSYLPPDNKRDDPTTPAPRALTTVPTTQAKTTPKATTQAKTTPKATTQKPPSADDTCDASCCVEQSKPTVTIPIKLNGKTKRDVSEIVGKSAGCDTYAKLVVPADSISADDLKNPANFIKNLLQSYR